MRRDRREKEKKGSKAQCGNHTGGLTTGWLGQKSRKGLALTGGQEEFTHATTVGLNLKDLLSGEKVGKRFSGPSLHAYSPFVSFRVDSVQRL